MALHLAGGAALGAVFAAAAHVRALGLSTLHIRRAHCVDRRRCWHTRNAPLPATPGRIGSCQLDDSRGGFSGGSTTLLFLRHRSYLMWDRRIFQI